MQYCTLIRESFRLNMNTKKTNVFGYTTEKLFDRNTVAFTFIKKKL